jgi:large subunit ribosomal protein L9
MANSQVILLEHVNNLGTIGDTVSVKQGYARNYLLPQGKALRATEDNIAYFETQKAAIEAENKKKRDAAEKESKKVADVTIALIRQASEGGQLYGSVAARDISDELSEKTGIKIGRSQVELNQNFKTIGLFTVPVALHPEVIVDVTVNIARSEDEAKIQEETGQALIAVSTQEQEKQAEVIAAEELFEEVPEELNEEAEEESAEADAAVEETDSEEEKEA